MYAVSMTPAGQNYQGEQQIVWKPPHGGFLKLNWDAALDVSRKTMGAGAVIRDETGLVVAAMAKRVRHVHDPLAVEEVALWRAIVFCREVGVSQVEFEGDSLGVVRAVNNGSSCWSSYGHLMDDIRTTLAKFPNSVVQHVK
jgi:ribonuclease HI